MKKQNKNIKKQFYCQLLLLLLFFSCNTQTQKPSPFDKVQKGDVAFDLEDIQETGELIVLTRFVDDSFFEFRGEYFGRQYMLANEFAKSIGTRIRVDACKTDQDMLERLKNGEGDIIAYNIPDSLLRDKCPQFRTLRADTIIHSWLVSETSPELADTLQAWICANNANLISLSTLKIRTRSGRTYTPRRRVSAPIRNLARGEISVYDQLFKQYSKVIGWDWRLLAAQSYQESAFDPDAVSYMGAMGLMQLMPSTANDVGVSQDEVFTPEHNVRGAVRLIYNLNEHYSYISPESERINFILAAYNAGPGHVDDARAVAKKYNKNPNVWLGNVDAIVLRMNDPRYYNLPEVQHGYFRGSETYNYVNSIRVRWDEYRRKIKE